jgi:hypothetical protein
MKSWLATSTSIAIFALCGCELPSDPVGTQSEALVSVPSADVRDDPPGPVSSATVQLRLPGPANGCTGTLVAPDLVLTAAHCVRAGYVPRPREVADAVFDNGDRIRFDACWVHPEASPLLHTWDSCEQLQAEWVDSVLTHHDLALLHLQSSVAAPLPRSFGPPRVCLPLGSRARAVLQFRGWRPMEVRRVVGPVVGWSDGESLLARPNPLQRGDSGGTIDAFTDPFGPILGVNSVSTEGPLSGRQPQLWQHEPGFGPGSTHLLNQDWLWSVLDPTHRCELGSPGPCVPERWPVVFPDTDGDGLPDVRDLCPEVGVLRPCGGQHCDVDRDFVGDECDDYDGLDNATGAPDASELVACDLDDPDGDHVPSSVDPCPTLPPGAHAETDSDGDGVVDECDRCDGGDDRAIDFALDTDRDGHPDGCDNCDLSNPSQSDCDGDGVGEACEDQTDSDGDMVIDVCDNCRLHTNPRQTNCNVDSESAAGVEARGDACDPDPCGDTRVSVDVDRFDPAASEFGRFVSVDVDGLLGSEDPEAAPTPLQGRTTFRFCRCSLADRDDPETRIVCARAQPDRTGECAVSDIPHQDAPTEREGFPWRWTTHVEVDRTAPPTIFCFSDAACPGGSRCVSRRCVVPCATDAECGTGRCVSGQCVRPSPVGLAPTIAATYAPPSGMFAPDRRTRWLLRERDVPRWQLYDPPLPAAGADVFPVGPGTLGTLPGVVWTHTPGPVGQPDFPFPRRAFTSHYWSRGIPAPVTVRPPDPCIQALVPFLVPPIVCPFCPSRLPEAFVGFGGPLCPNVQLDRPLLVLGPGVTLEQAPGTELPGLEIFTGDLGPWVAAAEPASTLEGDGLRYARVTDGFDVQRLVFVRDGQLVEGKQPCPVGQECIPFPFPQTASLVAGETCPCARRDAAVVLSARRELLWVLGGTPVSAGPELSDAWVYDVGAVVWRPLALPAGETLGHVLAATYSAIDDALYVLDEPAGRGGRRARLLRLAPLGETLEVVATWPRRSPHTRYALSADVAGGLWLAASPAWGRVHVVARLSVDHGARVDGWRAGLGRLAGPARADERGLTVVVERDPRRGSELVGYELAELRRAPGGERECF